jgi:hypothetical protein
MQQRRSLPLSPCTSSASWGRESVGSHVWVEVSNKQRPDCLGWRPERPGGGGLGGLHCWQLAG